MHDLESLSDSVLANIVAAPIVVALAGLVPEPWRKRLSASVVVLAALVYLAHGLGLWEHVFAGTLLVLAAMGARSYPAIGVAWLVHTLSDVFHHAAGAPMIASIPLSSFGCAIFDPLIAIWFFSGAPSTASMVRSAVDLVRGPVSAGAR